MHVDLLYPSDYLAAGDLQGRDVTLTISRIEHEELHRQGGGSEWKWVVYFREMESRHDKDARKPNKRLVLNKKTHLDALRSMYGTETNDWVGKRVTLYPTTTKFGRETVDCIRIRDKVPEPKGTKQ